MRRLAVGWVVALLAACSAGAANGDDDDDDDGVGASAAAGGSTTTGGGGGATAGTGGSGASTGGTGGTGGDDDTLFPMQVGYEWTYQVQAVGAGSVCSPGQYSSTVVGSEQLAGKTAFEISAWCTGVGGTDFYAPGAGDEVFFYYQGQWLTLVDPNLQEGHSWDYFNTSYTWHQESAVTVPAGTFTDCWTAEQNVSYTAYLTYCRGVGTVRSYSSDLTGAGWDAQLAAKNF